MNEKKKMQPKVRFREFTGENAPDWEQRKLGDVVERLNRTDDSSKLPRIEFEDIISGEGRLNKDINKKNDIRRGIVFDKNNILYGKLRPYLKKWYYARFAGIAIGDFWVLKINNDNFSLFIYYLIQTERYQKIANDTSGTKMPRSDWKKVSDALFLIPDINEQQKIGSFFKQLDSLIALHQRKPLAITGGIIVTSKNTKETLFYDYYRQWISVYKEGAIRKVTLDKYYMTQRWIEKLASDLKLCDLDRVNYQKLLNDYALVHERQTTMDFHHQLKGAILDAVDEGLVERDPTRKAIIKGRAPKDKKIKYLNQFELHSLLASLKLGNKINWDWFILLVAKTGMRFSEALALTPKDFDFAHQKLSINKTWNYKDGGGFSPTKNKSSVRKIQIDWQTVIQFSELVKGLDEDKPIFVHTDKIYNSTINSVLSTRCKRAGVPEISIHGLRHTHASLLLFAGVSIASVARRLGHASMTTTQKTYLHIIQELENQDVDLVMRSLSALS